VVLASLAQDRFRPLTTAVFAVVLSLVMVFIFIHELRLSMPTFPWG